MAADNLKAAGANGASVYVRVNGWHTEYTNDDLEAVVQPGLDGITLPKTRNADDVKRLDWKISELEARRGIPAGTVKIAVLLETAEGIMNAYSICTASPRIVAAFFGAVDYCCDMRITRTNLAEEQKVARTIVAIAAVRPGILALDAPFADYSNMDDFRQNTLDGRQMGFEGRMIIHPSQIAVAHELYSPTEEEVAHARKVKKFFEEEGLAKGLASVSMDGAMVVRPFIRARSTFWNCTRPFRPRITPEPKKHICEERDRLYSKDELKKAGAQPPGGPAAGLPDRLSGF